VAQVSTPRRSCDGRRKLLVSPTWVQAVALLLLCGFAVLGFLAYRAYVTDPPIPDRAVTEDGHVLFTGEDVTKGQQVFLRHGLMEYGSILGHGAYLGPDFTADYLHRAAEIVTREYGSGSDTARQRVIEDFKANRYDPASGTLTYTAAQAVAFEELVGYYRDYFGAASREKGLRPDAITDGTEIRQLTSYFSWTAWAGSTLRPGKDYSYTNSWPPEPLVGNEPTANVVVWSVLSLIALLAGIGALFAAFGRWGDRLGWKGRQADAISFRPPGDVLLTPAQRACA
jgi:nitric oxide reductase subunit B